MTLDESIARVFELYERGAASATISRNIRDALVEKIPLKKTFAADPLRCMKINIAPRFFGNNFVMQGN